MQDWYLQCVSEILQSYTKPLLYSDDFLEGFEHQSLVIHYMIMLTLIH